jgi:hypothetical protein
MIGFGSAQDVRLSATIALALDRPLGWTELFSAIAPE